MENHQQERAGESLSPAETLEQAAAGRGAVARRIAVPWQWDACGAATIGIFMALIAYVGPPWTTFAILAWLFAYLGLEEAKRRRTGIVRGGNSRRSFDPLQLVVLVTTLAEVDAIEFAAARDDLAVSDSVLSKNVKVLADAGYLLVKPYSSGGRSRKRLAFTSAGEVAYAAHVEELKRLIQERD